MNPYLRLMRNGMTDPINERYMYTFRPLRSEKKPSTMSPIMSPIVVIDIAVLAYETDMPNSFVNKGRSGCIAYIACKDENRSEP